MTTRNIQSGRIAAAMVAGATLYLSVPGHPSAGFAGLPLDLSSIIVLAVVAIAAWSTTGVSIDRRVAIGCGVAAAIVIAVKAAIGLAAPVEGWRADYFANDALQPPARRSTDFRSLNATRIDRQLTFHDDTFPVYFFNENTFNRGIRREVSEPFSARWSGFVSNAGTRTVHLTLSARGSAAVAVDGAQILDVRSTRSDAKSGPVGGDLQSRATTFTFERDRVHAITVSYVKPADTDGLLELTIDDGRGVRPLGAPEVMSEPSTAEMLSISRVLARFAMMLHLAAVAVFCLLLSKLRPAAAVRVVDADRSRLLDRRMYAALALLFVAQGVWKAWPLANRFVSLTSGDDWLQYEAASREILLGGPLMTFGKPLGQGEPYFYYPLYSYFLAAVHWVTGEHLAGIVVAQFVALLVATIVIYRLGRLLFGRGSALFALILLLGVEQIAFVRNYTPILLADNLFFLTVAAAIYLLTRAVVNGNPAMFAAAGLLGGLSAITRPSIMSMLAPALVLVIVAARRLGLSWQASAGRVAIYASMWFAMVSLTLLRNIVVSGQPVLITTGQQWSFVLHNLPSGSLAQEYMWRLGQGGGSYLTIVALLFRLLWNYPVEFLSSVFTKIMFSLGMIQWMGGRVHPELLLLSVGYAISLALCPAARRLAAWPVHLFVATHLITLTLTMPNIYGYRLILPMYLFFAPFTGLVAWRLWSLLNLRRSLTDRHVVVPQ